MPQFLTAFDFATALEKGALFSAGLEAPALRQAGCLTLRGPCPIVPVIVHVMKIYDLHRAGGSLILGAVSHGFSNVGGV